MAKSESDLTRGFVISIKHAAPFLVECLQLFVEWSFLIMGRDLNENNNNSLKKYKQKL